MIRQHIVIKGKVQGVGFRYMSASIAARHHVTGWVRNNADGTVEMEVQGADHRVEGFIEELAKGYRFAKIKEIDYQQIPLVNVLEEKQFKIVREY